MHHVRSIALFRRAGRLAIPLCIWTLGGQKTLASHLIQVQIETVILSLVGLHDRTAYGLSHVFSWHQKNKVSFVWMFLRPFTFKRKYTKWNFCLEIRVTSRTLHHPAFPQHFFLICSTWAPTTPVWTWCWFREAIEKISRPGECGLQAAESRRTLDDISSRVPLFTESKSAVPRCHCGVLLWPAFRPCHTYSFCKNCIPCHAWKVPSRICVMRFPPRFLGKKKITEMNWTCATGSWSEAVLIGRKYANPR